MKLTANHVTLARIVLLPIPCGLVIWGEPLGMALALVLGIFLGATDFIDGYMARRDGPTVLGGMLDPAADKLFVAAFVLPLAAIGHCPPYVAGGIFARELLITALRSSMVLRDAPLKTSQLGKLKTVVQMGGLAVFYCTAFLSEPWMRGVNIVGPVVLALVIVGFALKKRWAPYWVRGAFPIWASVYGVVHFAGRAAAIWWIFILMLVLTWVSGLDYLFGAARAFRADGLRRDDVMRIISAVAHGFSIFAVVGHAQGATVALLVALATELALGGIDNAVVAQTRRRSRARFLPTTLLAVAVAAAALSTGPEVVIALAALQAAVGLALAIHAFRRDRAVFV